MGGKGFLPSRVVARLSLGRAGVSFSLLESVAIKYCPIPYVLFFSNKAVIIRVEYGVGRDFSLPGWVTETFALPSGSLFYCY